MYNNSKNIFVKIDVDGYELEVLNGFEKILNSYNFQFIIETHSIELEQSCIKFFQDNNFNNIKIIKNSFWRNLIPEKRVIKHNRWLAINKKNKK